MIRALRDWAERYRTRGKYTPVGVAFHWLMAGVVIYQLFTGWMMQRNLVGADKLEAYADHSQVGLTLLLFGGLRLTWRLMVPGPINDADEPGWRASTAHAIHAGFYALFVIVPVSGWIMWSAIQPARPLYLAGIVPVPAMPLQTLSTQWQFRLLDLAEDVHVVGIVALTLLVPAHAVAAIKHHFWDRDDVFEGMLPEVPDDFGHPSGARYSPKEPRPRARPDGD
ncbi:cytochrome b [Pelagerythrobacter marensis]|uniref:Cytochrome B561 n=1 Tax=Pelagerythrobacter marensis TaxID=543877 RepID=A0A0G3XAP4_9SPHN|nr:cytochrome b/b6 domain-containing protein [Pelagerythrobacter marensis]AKM07696.1 Cytochrome B561 [Pelagerythrobacter marensis]